MRKPIIVGNWKMNKTIAETVAFIEAVDQEVKDSATWGIAVPYLALQEANDITPIVCVGETLEQFEANTTEEVVRSQTNKAFQNCCPKCMEKVVIAYEPVWAIGTGKTATNEIAETTCAIIRDEVAKMFGQETADKVRIQYGGSVKPEGIKALLEQPNIDGALVGGASLQPDSYIAMINNLG